jgi:hypothetical protein
MRSAMTRKELLSRLSPPMIEEEWWRLAPNQKRWLLCLLKVLNSDGGVYPEKKR